MNLFFSVVSSSLNARMLKVLSQKLKILTYIEKAWIVAADKQIGRYRKISCTIIKQFRSIEPIILIAANIPPSSIVIDEERAVVAVSMSRLMGGVILGIEFFCHQFY